jgi:diguanylate cyclase (GGDEF)-like protein/PAS domain S-box-containing protein
VTTGTPSRSLSRRALLYVALVCAAIIVVDVWREWTSYHAVIERTRTEARNLASSLRHHAEDTYEIAEQAVTLVAHELAVSGLGADGIAVAQDFMRKTVETSGRLRGIHLIGADGRLRATTALNLPPGEDRSRHSYFRFHQAIPGDAAHAGLPIYSRDGAMEITVSRRIDDDAGKFAGVVVASIDTRYFSGIYGQIDTGKNGVVTLYNTSGTLLTRQPYRPELVGRDMSVNGPFQVVAATASGNYDYRSSVDGLERIGGWDRSSDYPLVTTVAISRDEALASWAHGALLRGLATLALTLVVAILGVRLVDQIKRRQKSDSVLAQREAEFRMLAESASDLVLRFDENGIRTYISPASERMLGYTPEEMLGQSAFDVVNPEDRPAVDIATDRLRRGVSEQETVTYRRKRKDGTELWLETSLRVVSDGSDRLSVVGVTRDISERKTLELQLERMAMRDGLTGLANRRAFDTALAREVARARRSGAPLSLLMIDADRFKRFNDDNGHLAGDTCLKAIAGVVAHAARRPSDIAARYGGEEMALLLPDTDLASAAGIAADITRQVEALAIPHARNSPWKVVTVSIGTAAIDGSETDALHDGTWLVTAADLALYDAKAHGRNQAIASRRTRVRLAG